MAELGLRFHQGLGLNEQAMTSDENEDLPFIELDQPA